MIQNLLRAGKKYRAGHLTAYCDLSEDSLPGRYLAAYLIPKLTGGAVERNRIKRWLREEIRRVAESQNLPGMMALRFNGMAEDTDHRSLSSELDKIVEQIRADG